MHIVSGIELLITKGFSNAIKIMSEYVRCRLKIEFLHLFITYILLSFQVRTRAEQTTSLQLP